MNRAGVTSLIVLLTIGSPLLAKGGQAGRASHEGTIVSSRDQDNSLLLALAPGAARRELRVRVTPDTALRRRDAEGELIWAMHSDLREGGRIEVSGPLDAAGNLTAETILVLTIPPLPAADAGVAEEHAPGSGS